MRMLSLVLVLASVAQSNPSNPAQTETKRHSDPHHEEIVDCDRPGPVGVKHVTSPVVSSPDLKSSAYVETIAEAVHGGCVNESRLYVKFPGDNSFRMVVSQKAEENDLGNKFIWIDWSADSKYLLIERMLFQYGSDAQPSIQPLLYSVFYRRLIALDLGTIDKDLQQRECLMYLRPAGFLPNGNVVIEEEVHPYFDPAEDSPRDAACPNRKTLWEIKVDGEGEPRQLPHNYALCKFGKLQTAEKKR